MYVGQETKKKVGVSIRNNLKKERREINVYHHSNRTSHIISYNQSLNHDDLGLADSEDYIHISVIRGPGDLKNPCILDFPSFLDFRFRAAGGMTLEHVGTRSLLKIPPGPPTWEIEITLPTRPLPPGLPAMNRINLENGDGVSEWRTGETGPSEHRDINKKGGFENGKQELSGRMFARILGWIRSIF